MRLISLAPKLPVKKSFIPDHPANNAMVTGQKDIKLVRVSGGSNMGHTKCAPPPPPKKYDIEFNQTNGIGIGV